MTKRCLLLNLLPKFFVIEVFAYNLIRWQSSDNLSPKYFRNLSPNSHQNSVTKWQWITTKKMLVGRWLKFVTKFWWQISDNSFLKKNFKWPHGLAYTLARHTHVAHMNWGPPYECTGRRPHEHADCQHASGGTMGVQGGHAGGGDDGGVDGSGVGHASEGGGWPRPTSG